MQVIIIGGSGEALARYQDRRIAQMNGMIVRNRNMGMESVLKIADERAPNGFAHIHEVFTQQELEHAALDFKRAAGLDIETVNSRNSLVELPLQG